MRLRYRPLIRQRSADAVARALRESRNEATRSHGAGAWDVADVMKVLRTFGVVSE